MTRKKLRLLMVRPKAARLADLPQERRDFLAEEANQIRASLSRDTMQVLDDGDRLIAIRDSLERGQWLEWIRDYLQDSISTIENYMRAAEWRRELQANGVIVNF